MVIGMMESLSKDARTADQIPLEALSRRLQLSQQTLVRWVDRHLVDARLGWRINDLNQEERYIEVPQASLSSLESFASTYRSDVVSRTDARRILKVIDRRQVKRLIRTNEVESREVDGETHILVGSLEDYLMGLETNHPVA